MWSCSELAGADQALRGGSPPTRSRRGDRDRRASARRRRSARSTRAFPTKTLLAPGCGAPDPDGGPRGGVRRFRAGPGEGTRDDSAADTGRRAPAACRPVVGPPENRRGRHPRDHHADVVRQVPGTRTRHGRRGHHGRVSRDAVQGARPRAGQPRRHLHPESAARRHHRNADQAADLHQGIAKSSASHGKTRSWPGRSTSRRRHRSPTRT